MLRRPGPPFALAGLCAVLLAIVGVLAFLVPGGHRVDVQVLDGFLQLDRDRSGPVFSAVAHTADPVPYAIVCLILAAVARARGRLRLAIGIPVLFVATGVVTQMLKQTLATPRSDAGRGDSVISAASWPSGHATASMTMGLALVLVAPSRWRPVAAAVGAAYAIGVSFSILVRHWHFPSDVLGGFLVAMVGALVLAGILAALEHRSPAVETTTRRAARGLRLADGVPSLILTALAGVAGLAVTFSVPDLQDRATLVVGASVIGLLAIALATLLAAALHGPRRTTQQQ